MFTGRTVPSGSVDPKAIKEAIEGAVEPMMMKMTNAFHSQKQAMEEMSMELFGKNMGHQQEDQEWMEVEEALRNWCNWGKPGTGYGHLPVVEEWMLRRVDSPEPLGSGTVSKDELLELKRTRRATFGGRVVDKSEDKVEEEPKGGSEDRDKDEIEGGDDSGDYPEALSKEDELEEDL